MGIIDSIKRNLGELFGTIACVRYDDSAIIEAAQKLPVSMNAMYRTQFKNIIDGVHQVFNAANCQRFPIGIIGDFTVGKSSFVNAILGGEIVPVSANPSTAVITKIEYGHESKAVVHYGNGKYVEMTYEDFLDFSAFNLDDFREREKTGKIQRLKDVVDATIYVKSEFLKKNNLCLIDTLGLSSHENDNKRTIASIKDAIALIYICDERGLSSKDIDFISTYLDLGRENLFFCINRMDLVRKSERENVIELVLLKLNDILQKKGCNKLFDVKRVFQVSSLYQYFANGFTDHEKWRDGIDYQARSGFVPLMKELSKYVKDNAKEARKMSVNNQLEFANNQIASIRKYRETEISIQKDAILKESQSATDDIRRLEKRISYVKKMFISLEQTIYGVFQSVYMSFSKDVDKHWEYTLKFHLIDQVSFDFCDYLSLEKDICALKLNIFKSMSDSRYSQLSSVSPFVDLTFQYVYDTLVQILRYEAQEISRIIEGFCMKNSLIEIMRRRYGSVVIHSDSDLSADLFLDTRNAMYRAAAEIAIESTWVKESSRKKKMFDAAKDEAVKCIADPIKTMVENMFIEIKHRLKVLFEDSVAQERSKIDSLNHLKNKNEKKMVKLKKGLSDEIAFYNKLCGLIVDAHIN